jgi:hypothetical protein
VIVVIMRHMRFLFSLRSATKPDKNLTEEVGGLFPARSGRNQNIYPRFPGGAWRVLIGRATGLAQESACVSDERVACEHW